MMILIDGGQLNGQIDAFVYVCVLWMHSVSDWVWAKSIYVKINPMAMPMGQRNSPLVIYTLLHLCMFLAAVPTALFLVSQSYF